MLTYIRYNNPEDPPYPAKVSKLGRVDCGDNPYLEAILVDGLRVEADADGEEVLVAHERDSGRLIRERFRPLPPQNI